MVFVWLCLPLIHHQQVPSSGVLYVQPCKMVVYICRSVILLTYILQCIGHLIIGYELILSYASLSSYNHTYNSFLVWLVAGCNKGYYHFFSCMAHSLFPIQMLCSFMFVILEVSYYCCSCLFLMILFLLFIIIPRILNIET